MICWNNLIPWRRHLIKTKICTHTKRNTDSWLDIIHFNLNDFKCVALLSLSNIIITKSHKINRSIEKLRMPKTEINAHHNLTVSASLNRKSGQDQPTWCLEPSDKWSANRTRIAGRCLFSPCEQVNKSLARCSTLRLDSFVRIKFFYSIISAFIASLFASWCEGWRFAL